MLTQNEAQDIQQRIKELRSENELVAECWKNGWLPESVHHLHQINLKVFGVLELLLADASGR